MESYRMAFVVVPVLMAATTLAVNASASPVKTSLGSTDSACVHMVPSGGSVDIQSMEVRSISGDIVAKHDHCSASSPGKGVPPNLPPQNAAWYASEGAPSIAINGSSEPFNKLTASFSVPNVPSPPAPDTPIIYFFP